MKQKRLYKIFIWGFLFLYLLVATISFFHAIQFFSVGNNITMSVVLAFAFEVGLALSLAAVLLSDANKKTTLPWILMVTLTAVQVIGNVFSTYKYMSLSETEYYQYLAKPLLFWIEGITEENVQIVVSWIIGAILPIIALFMTDMVATNIKNLTSLETGISETDISNKSNYNEELKSALNNVNINEPVKFDTKNFLDEENSIKGDSNPNKTTSSETDFQESVVSGAKVQTEKLSPLKKIINRLKNPQIKK